MSLDIITNRGSSSSEILWPMAMTAEVHESLLGPSSKLLTTQERLTNLWASQLTRL